MRPADDLWVDLVALDFGLDAHIWDGNASAKAPAWVAELEALVAAARGSVTPDELEGEAAIVGRMAEAVGRIPVRRSSWRWIR